MEDVCLQNLLTLYHFPIEGWLGEGGAVKNNSVISYSETCECYKETFYSASIGNFSVNWAVQKIDHAALECRASITENLKLTQDRVTRGVVLDGRLHCVALNAFPALKIFWFFEEKGSSQTHTVLLHKTSIPWDLSRIYCSIRCGFFPMNLSDSDNPFRPGGRH